MVGGVIVTLKGATALWLWPSGGRGCVWGCWTCAIPPTFGEVGAMVILKIMESVFFYEENAGREYDSQLSAQSVCP